MKMLISTSKTLHKFALATLMLVPAVTQSHAETFNMPQFGRVEKQVTEPIDFYDMKGTGQISSSSSNNSFATVVFTPASPGEAVQIRFSKIHLKGDGAVYPVSLSIFNGNYYNIDLEYPDRTMDVLATDFPDNGKLLERYFSAADKTLIERENVTFTSTEPDGALSVCFLYKYAAACDGWEAQVTSVSLTEQEIVSVTPDYSGVTADVYCGLKNVTLGSLNIKTDGILNPFDMTSLGFTVNDPDNILENIRLCKGDNTVEATPSVTDDRYTYTLDNELTAGDNIFTVKADIRPTAPFYSSASVTFDALTTTAPVTPAIAAADPVAVTVAAMVLMPADGSHITARIETGHSVQFYDAGGPAANYPEQSRGTVTFLPAEGCEGKVMIDFSNIALFNTNPARNDQLIVYDGTEADPDKALITLLSQTSARVRSTSPDGALTVSFSTTTGVTKAGWEAAASLFVPQPMTLTGTDISAASEATLAAGDACAPVVRLLIKTQNTEPAMTLSGMTLDYDGTAPQWERVTVYSTRNTTTFDPTTATELSGAEVSATTSALTFGTPLKLLEGDNYIWITADVRPDAVTGNRVNAIVKSLTLNGTATEITAPETSTGREVLNQVFPSKDHPVKTVYGTIRLTNKPYSDYYSGYDGNKDDLCVTFLPSAAGHVCEIDFSKLNLYYYESQWYPSSNVTPVFEVYSGTAAEGTPAYVHTKDANLAEGADASAIGTIRSASADGALTVRFNAGATGSSMTKGSEYGFIGEVRQYLSRPMTVKTAEAFPSGLTTVPVTSATAVPVIGINIETEGNLDPVSLQSVTFTLKGDTSVYTKMSLASSGHNDTPQGATVIATAQPEGDTVTFDSAATLAEGDNTFWLLAGISPDAAPGSVIDAKVSALTAGGAALTVVNPDPEGEILTVNTYDPVLGDKEQVVEVGEYPVIVNGVTAAYLTNDYTLTARPALAGGKITAKFTEGSFNVNPSNQYITVTGGAEPLGVDCNTVYPVSVTSVREDGSLTIEYHSMTIAREEGWKCELSCDARQPLRFDDIESIPTGNGEATRGSDVLLSGMKITVAGDKNPITVSSLTFGLTDNDGILTGLRLYATGADATFIRNTPIAETDGSTATFVPAAPLTFETEGTYHFWIQGTVADDAPTASTATLVPGIIAYTADGKDATAPLDMLPTATATVVDGFKGTFRIGLSAEARYADISSAVADMSAGIEGSVTLIVEPGTYNERVELDHIQGVSETNTITIRGESGDPADAVLVWNQWSEPPYTDDKLEHYYGVLTLRGTSHVTVEGLTVRTTNVQFPSVVHIASGCSDIAIDNCVISAPTSNTTYNNLTLVNSYVAPSATAPVNERLAITNTSLTGGYTAVKFGSGSMNQPVSDGLTIEGCSFADQGYQAVYAYMAKGLSVIRNRFTGTGSYDDKNYCQMIDLNISGPSEITGNILKYDKTGVYGMYLRTLDGSAETPVLIANNIIDINTREQSGAGIQLYNSSGKPFTGFTLAHNTVQTATAPGGVAIPLIINVKSGTTVSGTIANNLWQCADGDYVIKEQYGPSGAAYRNNAGYTEGATYAYWGGSYDQEMTFSQWVLASGETDGINIAVPFDDSDSARPLYPATFDGLQAGIPLDVVTTDIEGMPRDTEHPTVGAYEYIPTGIALPGTDGTMTPDGNATFVTGGILATCLPDSDVTLYNTASVMVMSTCTDTAGRADISALPAGFYIAVCGNSAWRLIMR